METLSKDKIEKERSWAQSTAMLMTTVAVLAARI